MKISVIGFIGVMANVVSGLELTADNFEMESEGKTAFIKFFAPWCGHCKKMKPAWDDLMKEFEGSASQLVAEVDCTSDGGKPLCEANGVRGYPTLKWGDPASLEDYSGGRDLETMKKFARENLKPICSPSHIDLCDADQQTEIKAYLDLGEEALKVKVDEKTKELEKVEEDFKTFVESLQEQYKNAMEEKDTKQDEIKKSGLGLMQKCLVSLKKKKHDEL